MPLPTRRLAAVLAVASLAVLALPDDGWASLLAVDGLVLVVALVDLLLSPRPSTVEVARDLPGVVSRKKQLIPYLTSLLKEMAADGIVPTNRRKTAHPFGKGN